MSVEHLGACGKSVLPAMHCISLAKAGRPNFLQHFGLAKCLLIKPTARLEKEKIDMRVTACKQIHSTVSSLC